METILQSPSIESFSYSWLANLNPTSFEESFIAIDASDHQNHDDEASFIEMDPRLPPSKRFIRVSSSDFGFDFPVLSDSTLGLVHADELISNGFVVPLFVKDLKIDSCDNVQGYYTSTDDPSTSLSDRKPERSSNCRVRCASLRRCSRVSKRFFQKYLKFLLRPLFNRRRRSGYNGQFDQISNTISPRTSLACSVDDNWRRSCDSESSIIEAVLHCKRTQGKLYISIYILIFIIIIIIFYCDISMYVCNFLLWTVTFTFM